MHTFHRHFQYVDIRLRVKGGVDRMRALLGEMTSAGVAADVITYNSALKVVGAKGLIEEAEELVMEMSAAGVQPSGVSLRLLYIFESFSYFVSLPPPLPPPSSSAPQLFGVMRYLRFFCSKVSGPELEARDNLTNGLS